MTTAAPRYGFRVAGGVGETRRLVQAAAAFAAHCTAAPKSQPDHECYLSAFRFGDDFRDHLARHHSPRGFAGACGSPWLWFDIDREDLSVAVADTRKLVSFVLFRYTGFADDDVLTFFTGRKGFHVGVPLTHGPPPSVVFHRVCRRLAEDLAREVGVAIDTSIYTLVQPFRAPNSRHPKTGLHKRRVEYADLMKISADKARELAAEPFGFDVPAVTVVPPELVADWQAAEASVAGQQAVRRPDDPTGQVRLNRDTLAFIRDGADAGERHARLFRAAANLRELAAPHDLIHALLSEAARDSGLAPADVRRQIACGIAHADRPAAGIGGAA